jgi:four helix bundle protein
MNKSFKDLDIYKISLQLFFKTHELSKQLPKHELYELGSQIRRSSESVVSNIVEGYGRRSYKQEFLRFLIFSHASNIETISHLEKLKFLYPEFQESLTYLLNEYDMLGIKIYNFKCYVQKSWKTS